MTNEILNSLLREYEQKKVRAQLELEHKKNNLYQIIPSLKKIDDELNSIGISTSKNILLYGNSDSNYVKNLKKKTEELMKEKKLILEQHDYSLEDLQPDYDCKICQDTGYITTSHFQTETCSCLKQKLLDISFNKSNMYHLEKENFSTFCEDSFSDKTDFSKYHFHISPRENIKNIKQGSLNFIENFDNPDTKNLLFTGSTGLR